MDQAVQAQRSSEELPGESQRMLQTWDSPGALADPVITLTDTLRAASVPVDDLRGRGLLIDDQIPVSPRHARQRTKT